MFRVLNNMFKTCSILQTKSNLVCLHGQHGEFLTKEKCKSLVSVGVVCTSWSSRLFHTAPFINSLLQLVQNAVINSFFFFFYISRRATCFRFVSGSRCDSRKLLHPPLIEQTLSTHCVAGICCIRQHFENI